MAEQAQADPVLAQSRPAPLAIGPLAWLRANLFSTWYNALLTLAIVWLIVQTVPGLLDWLVFDAVWGEASAEVCRAATGACWAFVHEKFRFVIFGLYPYDQQWRPALVVLLMIALIAVTADRRSWHPSLAVAWVAGIAVMWFLMAGGSLRLPYTDVALSLRRVPNTLWGGLPLTLGLSAIGLAAAFPLGILLALGRRSTMPAIRVLSIAYIELIRGVPLITVLVMASVLFPLFLPAQVTIDKLLRAQVGLILFAAAYLAEVVRGGLQAIPRGQYEAADSLGLSYWQAMGFIILPQALRISIPPLVNTFIGFLKDTSLVTIIGLYDLLGAAKSALTDAAWRGFYREAYLFIGLIYFAFCFSMSRYSQALERKVNVGTRRQGR